MAGAEFSADFEADPLFFEEGILPGDEFSKYFQVFNSDYYSREVYIQAENYEDADLLGGQIAVKILDHDTSQQVYAGTLSGFSASGWIKLPDLGAGDEARYDVLAEFSSEAGNAWQKKELEFDIVLRSESDQGGCICHRNCGHQWQWRHWHYWNNAVKHWLKKFSRGRFRWG